MSQINCCGINARHKVRSRPIDKADRAGSELHSKRVLRKVGDSVYVEVVPTAGLLGFAALVSKFFDVAVNSHHKR